ncbi:Gpi18-like mannosyltransferase [Desulfofundulus luciae]|uniref:Gpi18-like mannosyltransferase n=1 Tax=Desulfofundulus luciae TaxID=74702 RepID=A0ABU0B5G3_9FIRM|nr:mannosyltransferase family protein [Desulfofundulus luciae]MDQ0286688.1 Gpi18-like mannosyltransferase [Desulfofundulus luciae]
MFRRLFSLFNLDIVTIYLAHQLLIVLAGYFAVIFFPGHYDPRQFFALVGQGLNRWDAGWYLRIAQEGYNQKSAAFFPLYPLLIHLLSRLGVGPAAAGIFISNLSLAGILAIFYRLASMDYDPHTSRRATWYLALFPTAFYLSAIYTESLYLLLVLMTFYFFRQRRWLPAGLCGMLAASTRNMGVFLLFPGLWEYWRATKGKISKDIVFLALIPAGLLFFMIFLQAELGNPLAFVEAQQFWHRSFSWPWVSLEQATVLLWENRRFSRQLLDISFTLVGLASFFLSLGKERPSYTLFALIGLLVPLFSPAPHAPLLSMPRFVMVLFPIYLTLARLVKEGRGHNFILALTSSLFFFLYLLFARGYWVA